MAARDEFTGEIVFRPVTDLFRRTAPGIARVALDAVDGRRETSRVTGEHPLFVEGKGWTPVRSLRPGDRVSSRAADRPLTVAGIAHDSSPTPVYNLEIAQDHSYFAGEAGAWAHNGGRIPVGILRQWLESPLTPKWIKGWYQRQINSGKRLGNCKNPPGIDLGHHPAAARSTGGEFPEAPRFENADMNRRRPRTNGNNPKWR